MKRIERIRDIELRKAQLTAQLDEYVKSLQDYADWMEGFRKRTGLRHPLQGARVLARLAGEPEPDPEPDRGRVPDLLPEPDR